MQSNFNRQHEKEKTRTTKTSNRQKIEHQTKTFDERTIHSCISTGWWDRDLDLLYRHWRRRLCPVSKRNASRRCWKFIVYFTNHCKDAWKDYWQRDAIVTWYHLHRRSSIWRKNFKLLYSHDLLPSTESTGTIFLLLEAYTTNFCKMYP